MKNDTILTYDDVKKIKNGNSDEILTDVRSYDDSITAQYEKFDMIAYTGLEIFVRETVARKLAVVNKQLKTKYGLMLKVVYGYRSLEVQTYYFNKKQDELRPNNGQLSPEKLAALAHNFIAVPEVAGHVTGGAIDVTLVNSDGVAYDMGTRIADFTDEDRIKTFGSGITVSQRRFRQILLDEMMSVGFAPFLGEWWHFSYGDKEWAAYYGRTEALYGPILMRKTATVAKIADGNETAIQIIKGARKSGDEQAGKALMNAFPSVEQAGLLYIDSDRLEMAGGEFCGNASAVAAVLLTNKSGEPSAYYSVSGFEGSVAAEVASIGDNRYRVRATFNVMSYKVESSRYKGRQLCVVDMKGIVHVLIEAVFPASNYESQQRKIVDELNLGNREAVGVIWYEQQAGQVKIDPVVWVKEIDTLYYESACGSGAIAVALATDNRKILQPTGAYINVYATGDKVTTECEVTIIN
jgi:D-alanyl-D-alanine dipeptidase/diaminopimelate epimerase